MAKSGKKKNNKGKGGAKGAQNTQQESGPQEGYVSERAPMTVSQRIAWYSILALVFLVPVAMSNWTWLPGVTLPLSFDQFDIIKVFLQRFFTLIAFGAWAWHILVEGGRIRRTKVDWLILALLAWILITTFTSIHAPTAIFGKYRRFEGLLSFVNYALVFWLVTQFVDRASRVRTVAKAIFFSSIIVNGYGLLQYLGLDPVPWGNLPFEANRSFSTYGNPDLLGGFIVISLCISIVLALSEKEIAWRITYWVGFVMAAFVWLTAFTRSAWVGGILAFIIIGVVLFLYRYRPHGVDWAFMGVGGVGVVAIFIRSLGAETAVMNAGKRFVSIFDANDGSSVTRFEIWDAAWSAIKARPIQGFGADTFRLVFPKYKPIEYVADAGYLSVADNVHNYPLQMAAALGVPGFLLLYGLFVAIAVFSAPIVFRRQEGTSDRLVLAGFWAACAGYIAALSFSISVTGVTILLWVAMAVVMTPLAKSVSVKAPKWGIWVAAVLLVVIAALLAGNAIYFRADYHFLRARIVTQGFERVEAAERAVELNPYNDMYRTEVGMAHTDLVIGIVSQANTEGQDTAALTAEAESRFRIAEQALKDAIEFSPWEYDNYVFLTNLYNFGGEMLDPRYYEDAIEVGEMGVEVEKHGPAVRFQVSRALMATERLDEAREHMEFAVEMDPNYSDGWYLLGEIYRRLGMYDEAIEAFETVKEIQPETPGIDQQLEALKQEAAAGGSE